LIRYYKIKEEKMKEGFFNYNSLLTVVVVVSFSFVERFTPGD